MQLMNRTLLTAHSGCEGTPDNSLAFLQFASGLAVDCLEVDVRSDKSGTLILSHDSESFDAPELRQAFRTIRAVPGLCLNCDLKTPGLERLIWQLAGEEGVTDRLVYSGEVSAEAMAADREMAAAVRWFFNLELRFPNIYEDSGDACENLLPSQIADVIAGLLVENGAACLNLNWRLSETPLWAELRRARIPLSVWTPDDPEVLRLFLEQGGCQHHDQAATPCGHAPGNHGSGPESFLMEELRRSQQYSAGAMASSPGISVIRDFPSPGLSSYNFTRVVCCEKGMNKGFSGAFHG